MKLFEAWLKEAEQDALWAKDSLEHGYFSRTCFIAQQIGEKSLKALAYAKGAESVRGHSITALAKQLGVNNEIESIGRELDLYYISARYPDSLPDNTPPSDFFSREQAERALSNAERLLFCVKEMIQTAGK
jgi:HEPN domain-containing protein